MNKESIKQLELIKESLRIAKLPPCKTLKGQLRRAAKIVGLALKCHRLQMIKRKLYNPKFASGGVVNGESNEIFVDGREFVIPCQPKDDEV